ncbi:FMN-dependent NADH-azoreductase [Mucilaginibacter sp. ZT4R22]|uniref:FMN dependent NADH:quinone oxidoreductase n=1 Tax=Mucilaginibacter pankratovii TaxID=2772110 RepID=A0ABR7WMW0_9SPHI|nr:FMN-dependent NADH-azoreductase [Mucilaginibacter pankratovii]MBD1363669.1 FMN-dependent NADH-azoreductase [Mucilaginibacter pankratovii]
MKKILHIISSPRGAASLSIQLGNAIISKIKETYPGSIVVEKDLAKKPFPHLEEAQLTSFFTPAENRTPEHEAAIKHSDESIQEIRNADIIVIGAPLYNFQIPSTLKAWIDHIARAGVTFKYDENGPEGLIKGKKVYVAITSGGIYTEGPMKAFDFIEPYLRATLSFLGMADISFFRIEGSMVPGVKETAIEKGVESILID